MGNILSDNIAFLNSVSLKIAFLAIARERAKKYNQQHTSAEANIYESSISETRMFEDYARARHTPTRQIRTALGTIPKHLIFVTYFLCKSRAIRCTNEVFLSVRSRRLHHPLARYSFHQSIASCMYTCLVHKTWARRCWTCSIENPTSRRVTYQPPRPNLCLRLRFAGILDQAPRPAHPHSGQLHVHERPAFPGQSPSGDRRVDAADQMGTEERRRHLRVPN